MCLFEGGGFYCKLRDKPCIGYEFERQPDGSITVFCNGYEDLQDLAKLIREIAEDVNDVHKKCMLEAIADVLENFQNP